MIKHLYGIDKHSRFHEAARLVKPGDEILDVGGGKGDFFAFSELAGVVSDLMPTRSLFGKVASPFPFVPFDGLSLPFRSETFDLVVCLDTLEHVPREKRPLLLKEIQRVSRDRIVITFPERQFFLPVILSLANLYSRVGFGSVMQRSLQEHLKYGLPVAKDVVSLIDQSSWSVSQSYFFGRASALIWIMQLLLPLLATSSANRSFSYFTSHLHSRPTSECLIFLQRRRSRDGSVNRDHKHGKA